jgi:alpha-beta hydrolase superfamily lysophospholipase
MTTQTTTFTFADPDGFEIFVYKWAPDDPASAIKGIVQIAHGAAEHALRYERFGKFLNEAGYVVYANDHRGHWKSTGTLDKAGIAGTDCWNGIVKDVKQLSDVIRQEYPDLPLFLFGHSMGSLIAQQYMQHWGDQVQAVVLSGTFGSLGDEIGGVIAMANQMIQAEGADSPSPIFDGMFAGFNEPFEPGKTGFEWLSRDEAEVQQYVDDPWCGFPFSNRLVRDFLAGGVEIWRPENEARIPKDLPILIASGERDPVGGPGLASVQALIDRYHAQGLTKVTLRLYPEARHEILNETNRDQVQRDVVDWLDSQLGQG